MSDRDDGVESASWSPDAEDDAGATATVGDERETVDVGTDGAVAPWETGHGTGGPLRATGEVLATIVGSVIAAIVLIFAGVNAYVLLAGTNEIGTIAGLLITLVGSQAGFAVVSYAYLRRRGEPLTNIGVAVPDFREVVLVIVGVIAAFVLATLGGAVVQQLGLQAAENTTATTAAGDPTAFLYLIPVAIFVVGPCEELLFRGVVQRRFREVASAPVAIAAASALFAGVHVMALQGGLSARLTTIVILFFPALVFGILYEYTKNIVVTSLVHGLYDAVLFGLLYVVFTYAPEGGQAAVAFATTLL